MDSSVQPQNASIRKIEDIIDIQKAKGNFSSRQVAFNLPQESGSTVPSNLAKSLETGFFNTKPENSKTSFKKLRTRRRRNPLPDVISWPSDSDITVLRMKLCLTANDLKDNVVNTIPGDGLHHPDSSSMVNLATLILQSQHPSEHSVDIEEYLLPLTSWEQGQTQESDVKEPLVEKQPINDFPKLLNNEIKAAEFLSMCSYKYDDNLSTQDSALCSSKRNTKSRVARFLRLYFCPCCTCLYKLERTQEEPSVCFAQRREIEAHCKETTCF